MSDDINFKGKKFLLEMKKDFFNNKEICPSRGYSTYKHKYTKQQNSKTHEAKLTKLNQEMDDSMIIEFNTHYPIPDLTTKKINKKIEALKTY